jgi:Family of unknown function (DUF5362)
MENIPGIRKIELEEEALKDLDKTRKWTMFLAILGFIFTGIILIGGLITSLFLTVFKTEHALLGVTELLVIVGILLFVLIYFFPMLYLFRFSKHTSNAVRTLDKQEMHSAFRYLRKYYVYIGILTIIVIAVYFVAIIAAGSSMVFFKDLGTGV